MTPERTQANPPSERPRRAEQPASAPPDVWIAGTTPPAGLVSAVERVNQQVQQRLQERD